MAAEFVRISASLYGADPLRLADAVAAVTPYVASLHIDIMDGRFAPAFGFGERLINGLMRLGAPPIDVHLMVDRPEPWAKRFAALGVRRVAFHLEAVSDPIALTQTIRTEGSLAYIGLLPHTSLSRVLPLRDEIDGLLLLTAPPGGGVLNSAALARVRDVPKGLSTIVDGRLGPPHFDILKSSGVDIATIGAALFDSDNVAERAKALALLASTECSEC